MHPCFESHKDEITFVINTFPEFIKFKRKNTLEPNVLKCVLKQISPISSAFSFLISNIMILVNFEKQWWVKARQSDFFKKPCNLLEKKTKNNIKIQHKINLH
jgi:hypothetical protein